MAFKSVYFFITVLIFSLSGNAVAIPIAYDIDFFATTGTGGNGTFTVDSATLAAIPATGYYESDYVFSTGEAEWLGGTINNLYFDGTWRNGFAIFIAEDGQASDITALANDGLISFDTLDGYFEHELYFESDGTWNLYSYWPYVDYFIDRVLLAEGTYTITRVPEPSILALLALGMSILGFMRSKRV